MMLTKPIQNEILLIMYPCVFSKILLKISLKVMLKILCLGLYLKA